MRAECLPARRSAANGMQQKLYNWNTLNSKVLKKLGMQLTKQQMADIANGVPGSVERALKLLRVRLSGATDESFAAASGSPAGCVRVCGGAEAVCCAVPCWDPSPVGVSSWTPADNPRCCAARACAPSTTVPAAGLLREAARCQQARCTQSPRGRRVQASAAAWPAR
jgi:hypothetical protein